ncbi:MAG: hypothetical protein A3F89_07160 [Deltaproteobacteria bacterium RIFCSPLOWO2_12_FULL_50_11]|nr:MAG: hypothetical protein A3B79_00415 [Deltaproteobacteria bacterium RIFCSPHIGHO2_02_FULL_50_15]OGQ65375.1 MAG: hypothetical protein A3F89_07160 [Deltaproteobacteria bacterium RIFCSPLOWO2_12_FULL_50_11]
MTIFLMKFWITGMVVLLVLTLPACGRRGAHHPKPTYAKPPVVESPRPGPEREASNHLLDEGKKYLDFGMYNQAAYSFQEAISIDPNNGEAFYYLASTKYREGEYGRVPSLLDRASLLLQGNEEWGKKIQELKDSLREVKP